MVSQYFTQPSRMDHICPAVVSQRNFTLGWTRICRERKGSPASDSRAVPMGTLTTLRSRVRILVDRKPTSSIVPRVSPVFGKSPTRVARSKMMEIPPRTFSKVFWAARAMAISPTPSPGRTAAGLRPKRYRATSNPVRRANSSIALRPRRTTELAPCCRCPPGAGECNLLPCLLQEGTAYTHATIVIKLAVVAQHWRAGNGRASFESVPRITNAIKRSRTGAISGLEIALFRTRRAR